VRLRPLLAVARADLRERLRRYSFLAAMGGAIYFGYLIEAGYVSLTVEHRRGVMSSAWVGTLTALALGLVLPLVGFYLVKNTLERDRTSGVGEILAASPLTPSSYVAGKALSNFLVLAALAAVPVGAAVLLQLTAGEDRSLHLGALCAPVVWLTMPPLALAAALAVLFECVRWLRGALGNVLFFALWNALLVVPVEVGATAFDVTGLRFVRDSIYRRLTGRVPPGMGEFALQIGPQQQHLLPPFRWDGLAWSGGLALRIVVVCGMGLGVLLLAALFFDRFDPARAGHAPARAEGMQKAARRRPLRLPHVFVGTSFGGLVVAELRLMLAGRNRWWTLVALGLLVAGFAAPLEAIRGGILPVAWLWPLALWSGMGAREARHGTGALVFSSPRPLSHHALAIWTAGALVALLTGLGAGVRLLAAADRPGFLAWAAACAFIPSLALALGAWSGGTRLFETSYLLLWYVGPMNRVASLDYMGVTAAARESHLGGIYLGLALVLLIVAIAGRRRQAWAA